jgi:hypothetical protein
MDLKELLKDAEACARLSQWEEEFLDSMREKALLYGDTVRISDKQQEVLNRIEQKVYA